MEDLGTARFPLVACVRVIEHLDPDGPVSRQMRDQKPSLDQYLLRAIHWESALGAYYQTDTTKAGNKPPKPIQLPGDLTGEKKRSGADFEALMQLRQDARMKRLARQEGRNV